MAVTLRLSRAGGKKRPFYRVVAADTRSPRDGRFIEQIGIYDPLQKATAINVDVARLDYWLKVGARPSETVQDLIRTVRKNAAPATTA
jgi:small subunit ribosomal protein S16